MQVKEDMNLLAQLISSMVFVIASPVVWAEDMSVERHQENCIIIYLSDLMAEMVQPI